MSAASIYGEIMDRLRRAKRNGQRLHLDPEHVDALIASPIFPTLAELEAEELSSWQDVGGAQLLSQAESSSATSGSSPGPSAKNGASLGTMAEHVHDADAQRVSDMAANLSRQSRRNRHSRRTSPKPPARPSHRPQPMPVSPTS